MAGSADPTPPTKRLDQDNMLRGVKYKRNWCVTHLKWQTNLVRTAIERLHQTIKYTKPVSVSATWSHTRTMNLLLQILSVIFPTALCFGVSQALCKLLLDLFLHPNDLACQASGLPQQQQLFCLPCTHSSLNSAQTWRDIGIHDHTRGASSGQPRHTVLIYTQYIYGYTIYICLHNIYMVTFSNVAQMA